LSGIRFYGHGIWTFLGIVYTDAWLIGIENKTISLEGGNENDKEQYD